MDSNFIGAFNQGNTQFGVDCGEQFEAVKGKCTPGLYMATTIDDLSAATAGTPGGRKSENTVTIYIDRAVLAQSGIEESDILIVRGNRVRVGPINDDGDNTLLLDCKPASLSF